MRFIDVHFVSLNFCGSSQHEWTLISTFSIMIPYSGLFSREKTFANFVDFGSSTKIFFAKICGL